MESTNESKSANSSLGEAEYQKIQKDERFLQHLYCDLNYKQCLRALKTKYGKVSGSYFIVDKNYTFKQNKSIKRGLEGLSIHHDLENKYPQLSKQENLYVGPNKPYSSLYISFHQPDVLTYCNLLEHLILHLKIEYETGMYNNGVDLIINDIDSLYDGTIPMASFNRYQIACRKIVDEHLEAYNALKKCVPARHWERLSEHKNINKTQGTVKNSISPKNKKIVRKKTSYKNNKKNDIAYSMGYLFGLIVFLVLIFVLLFNIISNI